MKEYIESRDIKVRCNLPVDRILELCVIEELNDHAKADVVVSIIWDEQDFLEQEMNGQPIKIYGQQSGKELLLFSGVIWQMYISKSSEYTTLHIEAYSLSWFMDLEKKNRSYQNIEQSFANLIDNIADEHSFLTRYSTDDKKPEAPFIQYQETDWQFIIRMASHLDTPVIPAGNYDGQGIYIGFPRSDEIVELQTDREIWCMDANKRDRSDWTACNMTYYQVRSSQVCHLGELIKYHDEIVRIHSVSLHLKQGILQCYYNLAGPGYLAIQTRYCSSLRNLLMTGTVIGRKDELVQVHLDIDETQVKEQAYFYSWMPESGNLAYVMPEIGSRVRLLIPGEDEQKAFVTSCIREDANESQESMNPDHRWLVTEEGSKFSLYPGYIELSKPTDQSKIQIHDGAGPGFQSGGSILIQAKGKMELYGADIQVVSEKEISAVRRSAGDPTVMNFCHNVDVLGRYSTFKNLEELRPPISYQYGNVHQGRAGQSKTDVIEREEQERKKLEFRLKELLNEELLCEFEWGSAITSVLAAIPQSVEVNVLSQIAVGFRPIIGKMKGD